MSQNASKSSSFFLKTFLTQKKPEFWQQKLFLEKDHPARRILWNFLACTFCREIGKIHVQIPEC